MPPVCSSLSCVNLEEFKPSATEEEDDVSTRSRKQRMYSTSAPASTNSLLGNFEVRSPTAAAGMCLCQCCVKCSVLSLNTRHDDVTVLCVCV